MQEFGLQPSDLEIEITESVLMAETDSSLRIITHLRELGVGIAIDDFGTGYSSLSYLKRLHPTLLKMDRSFVRDADADDGSRAIVKGIIGLAQALNLHMVAEGVETSAQLAFLRDGGCQMVQGYLVARPMPAELLEQWLRNPPDAALFTAAG
jgi:EAL domain-containing protein (putative c-di-GMP-specific phosphodiesterase class I)